MNLRATLPLGQLDGPMPDELDRLEDRIAMVLETQVGTMPWRPDFGCDLATLVGEAATDSAIQEARWRVEQAIHASLPDVHVIRCEVRLVPSMRGGLDPRRDGIPLAETALMSLGSETSFEVTLEIATPSGTTAVVQSGIDL